MTEERAAEVLLNLQAHARLWEADARLLGNLRCGEVAEAITEVLVRREEAEQLRAELEEARANVRGALDAVGVASAKWAAEKDRADELAATLLNEQGEQAPAPHWEWLGDICVWYHTEKSAEVSADAGGWDVFINDERIATVATAREGMRLVDGGGSK